MLNYSNILGATIASSSSFIEFVLQSKILIIVIILQHHALCKICYIILSVVWLSSYHYFCVPTKKSDNRNRLLPSWSNLHLVLYASEHPRSPAKTFRKSGHVRSCGGKSKVSCSPFGTLNLVSYCCQCWGKNKDEKNHAVYIRYEAAWLVLWNGFW